MSTFHEEAAAAHGAMNPKWAIEFKDGDWLKLRGGDACSNLACNFLK